MERKKQLKFFNKYIKSAIIPGCIIGLMLSFGYIIKKNQSAHMSMTFACNVLIAVIISVLAVSLIYAIFEKVTDVKGEKYNPECNRENFPLPNRLIKKSWVYYVLSFVMLLIIWFPALLALYPGLYTYDAPWQYWMYCDGAVSEQQPIIHTYLMSIILDKMYEFTGEFNKGVLVCSALQMIIMSAGCAYSFYIFHKERIHTLFHVIAFIFWGLYPPFVIFVFTMTKDSIFAVAVMDFAVINFVLLKEGGKFFDKAVNIVLWIVFTLTVLVLRSNAVYAMLVFLPFWFIGIIKTLVKKKSAIKANDDNGGNVHTPRKETKYIIKAVLTVIITAVLFCIYKYPICSALKSQDTPKCEMLSVPTQQLARVYNYHYEELSEEEKYSIEKFFENPEFLEYYQPQIADKVKGNLDENYYISHKTEFISVWIKIGCEYPQEYIDSFLENTYAFWYPMPQYVIFGDGGEGYTNMTSTYPVEQNTKLRVLFDFYMQFENGEIVNGNNPIAILFSPALFMYILIIVMFYCLKKRSINVISLVFPLLLWLTFLLGPVAQVRYIVYLMALFPVMNLFIRQNRIEQKP